jgi:uncharacterized protein YdaU (DUF1376 family)
MVNLTLEERGAYNTLIDHQYLMEAPLPDNDGYIAGILGCDIRVWRRIKKQLVEKGRIVISGGHIEDLRASYELARRQAERSKRVASGQLGGISSGISRKNKDIGEASASTPTNQIREDKRREDNSVVANATTGGEPPPKDVVDLRKAVFDAALPALIAQAHTERSARSIIGNWRKQLGNDDANLLKILQDASRAKPADLVEWVQRCLHPKPVVRKNCEGWIIPHGTPEYEAWAAHYRRENSPRMYDFPDKAGTEARAPSRWPPRH